MGGKAPYAFGKLLKITNTNLSDEEIKYSEEFADEMKGYL